MGERKKKKIKYFTVSKDAGAQVNIICMTGTSQWKHV